MVLLVRRMLLYGIPLLRGLLLILLLRSGRVPVLLGRWRGWLPRVLLCLDEILVRLRGRPCLRIA